MKRFKLLVLIISFVCLTSSCSTSSKVITSIESPEEQQKQESFIETQKEQEINDSNLETDYYPFTPGLKYNLASDVQVGEEVEVMHQEGNSYLVSGTYANSLEFFRIYRIDNEGINIYYETTSDKHEYNVLEELIRINDFKSIYSSKPNQEMFILKSPYVVGNQWGYASITKIENKDIVVTFENGTEITFKNNVGVVRIKYPVPIELESYYKPEEFIAVRVYG